MEKHLPEKKCTGSLLHPEDGGRRFLWKPGNHLPDNTVQYPKINFHFVQACIAEVSPLHTKEPSSSNPNHTSSPWFLLISLSLESPGKFDNSPLTFTGRMLQHLQCSLAPAVGRMLQQLQRSACMCLFSSHHVYLRQKPKQTPLWFPQ